MPSSDSARHGTAGELGNSRSRSLTGQTKHPPPLPTSGITITVSTFRSQTLSAGCYSVIDDASSTTSPRLNVRSFQIYFRTYTDERCKAGEHVRLKSSV